MKKTCLAALLAVLVLLTGCGEGTVDVQASAPSPSPETWGMASIPPLSSSPAPTPTPPPTPTPEPLPESLRELVPDRISVWIDGEELEGLVLAGTTLVKEEDLAQARPGFHRLTSTEGGDYFACRTDGESYALDCTWVDGRDYPLEHYTGEGGVRFVGEHEEYWVPVRWAAELYGMRVLWDGEQGAVYLTTWVDAGAVPLDDSVPVLMYHAVSDDLWGIEELFVSPSAMEEQIQYLLDNGYDPIFFSDLTHLEDYDRPVILTFDDGYDDNYTNLFPLLQKYQVKATCFVITGMLGDEHYMTAEQVREMSDSGLVDIQSHTVDHDELDTLDWDGQEYQLRQSQLDIARITGKLPYVLAYPRGSRNGSTLELAPEYYAFGIDMNGGTWRIEGGGDNFQVDRLYVSRSTTLSQFAELVS